MKNYQNLRKFPLYQYMISTLLLLGITEPNINRLLSKIKILLYSTAFPLILKLSQNEVLKWPGNPAFPFLSNFAVNGLK